MKLGPTTEAQRALEVVVRALHEGSSTAWVIASDAWHEANDENAADVCLFISYAKKYGIVSFYGHNGSGPGNLGIILTRPGSQKERERQRWFVIDCNNPELLRLITRRKS